MNYSEYQERLFHSKEDKNFLETQMHMQAKAAWEEKISNMASAYRRYTFLMERSIEAFLREADTICFVPDGMISSQQLYELYRNWVFQNNCPLKTLREFCLFVKKNAPQYRLVYSENIPAGNGKHVRGFRGICAASACNADNTDNADNSQIVTE